MRNFGFLASLLLALSILLAPARSNAYVDMSVSVNLSSPPPVAIAPPPLPVYVVPAPPVVGYVWSPGYWGWNGYGYFWVPGTWVQAPMAGYLWTPGYWGWGGGAFAWHAGYWGPHVGFYGGINYGGGYGGVGFVGGAWNGGVYNVNRSVVNTQNVTNVTNNNVTNVTNNTVSNNTTNNSTTNNTANNTTNNSTTNNASFNGGPGGTPAKPTAEEQTFANEKHLPPTAMQASHVMAASKNPALAASVNHGKPAIAATPKAGDFTNGVVPAQQAGERNPEAEQHNLAVKKDPTLAKGAALPRESGKQPGLGAGPSPAHNPVAQHAMPAPKVVHPHPPPPERKEGAGEPRGE